MEDLRESRKNLNYNNNNQRTLLSCKTVKWIKGTPKNLRRISLLQDLRESRKNLNYNNNNQRTLPSWILSQLHQQLGRATLKQRFFLEWACLWKSKWLLEKKQSFFSSGFSIVGHNTFMIEMLTVYRWLFSISCLRIRTNRCIVISLYFRFYFSWVPNVSMPVNKSLNW